ncbi:VOC family protein [Bradyrhizobium sp. 62B]|jgi:catechol 2,3-dioxygenase-like lactoylglutathione lyase family enzyme|uniref:VOC family protein n=1 Tax=Bradyrhizobium TaxID=374 RepID=UPI0021682CC4|nr:VOC family protein [Bradyrhizobium centrosematis]MCS3760953.1 catechol 2,3-dioxygenase-like lactoylglutathione lyase family enzyme [Bradyrhizobium centrosematis]MCS3771158.1 catechol 2,3-dioxygenase-like lactoylglutathione lyase family enzyme [Bradyrhizobium centrosematis]WIW48332.1 VOC family protein [Bradyrhizobium sp. 62B]
MITGLDHVVVLVRDIGAAKAAYQTLLARAPSWQNSGEGADRVLFTLANMTIELMAPSGFSVTADRMRALLDDQEGVLASLCFRVADMSRMHRRLERVALNPDPVAEVESSDTETGNVLHWKRTRAATELTRGVRMFFLELADERPLSLATDIAPIDALDHVVVTTEDSERAAALYGARLGLDLALDRSHQDWGQLMFFRCGDLIVEVVRRPVAGSDLAHDRLWGLSWRVTDIDATRARLIAAGLDVTEVRNGRKPGTRIMTVRNGTCGIQTVLLERSPKPVE